MTWKKPWEIIKTKGQNFGKPKLTKAGKTFDVREWIQSNREDTEIYDTLEKYGVDGWKRLQDENKQEIYADITNMGDLRGNLEKMRAAEKMWGELPREIRAEFQNNKELFIEGGIKWAEKKVKEHQDKINAQKQEQTANNEQGENINA